jgi:hypothetical protein
VEVPVRARCDGQPIMHRTRYRQAS